jgi:hypothetical protein
MAPPNYQGSTKDRLNQYVDYTKQQPGSTAFDSGLNSAVDAYIAQAKAMGSGPLDVNNVNFDRDQIRRQLVMSAMPSAEIPRELNGRPNYARSYSPQYQSWLRYAQAMGYLPAGVTNPNQIATSNLSGLRR